MRTAEQVRNEIEGREESRNETWELYRELTELAIQLLESFRDDSQILSELYAEEHYLLTKERGTQSG